MGGGSFSAAFAASMAASEGQSAAAALFADATIFSVLVPPGALIGLADGEDDEVALDATTPRSMSSLSLGQAGHRSLCLPVSSAADRPRGKASSAAGFGVRASGRDRHAAMRRLIHSAVDPDWVRRGRWPCFEVWAVQIAAMAIDWSMRVEHAIENWLSSVLRRNARPRRRTAIDLTVATGYLRRRFRPEASPHRCRRARHWRHPRLRRGSVPAMIIDSIICVAVMVNLFLSRAMRIIFSAGRERRRRRLRRRGRHWPP